MQCQYEKDTIQCGNMAEQNQKYCKEHLKTVKVTTAEGTIVGAAIGALAANPIGIVVGAVIGGVYAYNAHKHKEKRLNK